MTGQQLIDFITANELQAFAFASLVTVADDPEDLTSGWGPSLYGFDVAESNINILRKTKQVVLKGFS